MPDTKARICDAATKLFNENGYDAVTMRDIAREANTSVGNLTYHFARKELLLNELLGSLHANFNAHLDSGARGEALLAHLLDTFSAAEENERAYPFYFRNLSEIYRSSAAIRNDTDRFAAGLLEHYTACLLRLQEDGLVRDDLDERSLVHVARLMVHLESSWLLPSSVAENPLLDSMPISDALRSLLELSLSDRGISALADMRGSAPRV